MPLKGQTAQWPSRWGFGGPGAGTGALPGGESDSAGPYWESGSWAAARSSRAPRVALGAGHGLRLHPQEAKDK